VALFDFLNRPKSILENITRGSGLDFLLRDLRTFGQKIDPIAQKAIFPYGFYRQAPEIGRTLQRTQIPFSDLPEKHPKLAIGVPGLQLPSLLQSMAQSYGRTLERTTTPGGRRELVESARRTRKQPFKLETLQEPAFEAALDISDILPVPGGLAFGLMKGGIKTVGKEAIEKVAKEMGEKAVKETAERATREMGEKYAFNINVKNLKITEGGEKVLKETVEKIKPELEKLKGSPLKHSEVLEEANRVSMTRRVVSREAQKKSEAALLKLRQNTTSLSNQIDKLGKNAPVELWDEYLENLKILSSQAAEKGRALEALKIHAKDVPAREKFLQEVIDITGKTDEIIEAAKGVDFNDAAQATKFYRKFVKASRSEILEWFRYNNMLSSPKTWMINLIGNLAQFPLSTAEKLVSGGIDFVASAIKPGRARKYYVREVPHYVKGFVNSIPDAIRGFTEALTGKRFVTRPDVKRVAPFTAKPAKLFEMGTRIMEAGDVFFREMFDAANKEALAYKYSRLGKEVAPEVLTKQAQKETLERIFRKPLKEADQGILLNWIDELSSGVYKLRSVPGVGWVVPFIQTPMNILKQGIEYSPMGFATIPGAKQKIPQLSKSLIGSAVFLGSMQLALEGRTAGKAPTGEKEKQAFYDSGRKQYSILIGDHWVSISKLGPIAYPIALAIMAKEAFEENPTDTFAENMGRTLLSQLEFFSKQSYLEGINNALQVARGEEYAAKQFIASMAGQVVPERAFLAWASRIIDDVYRRPKTFAEMMKSQIPFLSQGIEPYTGLRGQPSKRPYARSIGAFSPFDISPNVPVFEPYYQSKKRERISRKEQKKREKEGVGNIIAGPRSF